MQRADAATADDCWLRPGRVDAPPLSHRVRRVPHRRPHGRRLRPVPRVHARHEGAVDGEQRGEGRGEVSGAARPLHDQRRHGRASSHALPSPRRGSSDDGARRRCRRRREGLSRLPRRPAAAAAARRPTAEARGGGGGRRGRR